MDSKQFDELARSVANGISRRQALKLLVGGAVGLITNRIFKGGSGQALAWETSAVDPSSASSIAPMSITCQPTNNLTMTCEQLVNEYVPTCGTLCPDGERLVGEHTGGCTKCIADVPTYPTPISPISYNRENRLWCAEVTVTWQWTWALPPTSNIINFSPSNMPCCEQVCLDEIAEVQGQLALHEQGHRDNCNAAIEKVNADWNQRPFKECGRNKPQAVSNLASAIQNAQEESKFEYEVTRNQEPPQPRGLDCSKCMSGSLCQECRDNSCQPKACPDCTTCNPDTGTCDQVDCGDPCLECVNNGCEPKSCPDCTTCNPNTGNCDLVDCGDLCLECVSNDCVPIDCGSPCLECVNGSCQPKTCPDCTTCNPNTGTCDQVDCGDLCLECVSNDCVPIDCGSPCLVCVNGSCEPKTCPDCTSCNPNTGTCDLVDCGDPCLECVNNSCQPIQCGPCETCSGGMCVSKQCGNCEACDEATGACINLCSTLGLSCCPGISVDGQPTFICCPPETSLCCHDPTGGPVCWPQDQSCP